MAERVLRGSRLGSVSYESDQTAEMAPRQAIRYVCPQGHRFAVPLAEEADIPPVWECRVCGDAALRVDGHLPEAKKTKAVRTHWDMLMERRTVAELEELLQERLTVLRASRPAAASRRKSA